MSKIIGWLVVLAILTFGAYSYMEWTKQSEAPAETLVDPVVVEPIEMPKEEPLDIMEAADIAEQEAEKVEKAVAPSDSTDVEDIANDADIADIEKDLDGLEDLEAGLDTL